MKNESCLPEYMLQHRQLTVPPPLTLTTPVCLSVWEDITDAFNEPVPPPVPVINRHYHTYASK